MNRPSIAGAAFLSLGLLAAPGWGQEGTTPPQVGKPDAAKAEADAQKVERRTSQDLRCIPGAALRVQLVITRLQGEKKQASLPYTFVVSARPSQTCPMSRVRMRMGVDTPVPVVTFDASDPKKAKSTSVEYKTVGTNIDCTADDLGDGRFKLFLAVENSSALPGDRALVGDELSGFPLFRRFEISLDPILRDGQSTQSVASTDPVSGEVVKIDVTLNVVK
jgi:hypothetical protein